MKFKQLETQTDCSCVFSEFGLATFILTIDNMQNIYQEKHHSIEQNY